MREGETASPVFWVVDVSAKMSGKKIGAANEILEELTAILKDRAETSADAIKIATLAFANAAVWLDAKALDAARYSWRWKTSGGASVWGAACRELNDELSSLSGDRWRRPLILLFSNGAWDDDYRGEWARLKENARFRTAERVAVAFGDDANWNALREFADAEPLRPSVEALQGLVWQAFSAPRPPLVAATQEETPCSELLRRLVTERGRETLYDSTLIVNYLQRWAPTRERERQAIGAALLLGVPYDLLRANQARDLTLLKTNAQKAISCLRSLGLDAEEANFAVKALAYSYGAYPTPLKLNAASSKAASPPERPEKPAWPERLPSSNGWIGSRLIVTDCIDARAFLEDATLTEIVIPANVRSIGKEAFRGCRNLRRVVLPASLETIGWGAFKDCGVLEEVDFSAATRLKTIENSAFSDCWRLTTAALPESVATIGANAFNDCLRLKRLEIGDAVRSIGRGALSGCWGLTVVTRNRTVAKYCESRGVVWRRS